MSTKRKKKATLSTGVTLARLVDLSNFVVAFDTYNQILVLRGINNDPLGNKGRVLVKRFLVALQEGVEAHLSPIIMERPDAAVFRPVLRQALRPGSPETVAPKISALLAHFFPWLRTRQAVFASLFSGRAAKAAREVAMVVQEESLESRLNKAAMISPVSGLMIPRKWIEQAASAAGVPLSPVESLRTDAQVAQDLSTQLLHVEAKLQGANPQTPAAADLEGERLGIMENMERLAEQSVSPDVIKAIAVAPSPHPEHATAMGKKLSMTPEQEEAMMLTGKGIIAAGAGAGKTRVLAGKVVDTIERLGARSSQIIATSFSSKSAAELTSRVKNYGGGSVLDGGSDGFGTTHSIGKRMLHEFDPGVPRSVRVQEPAYIIKMAMEQVKLDPSTFDVPDMPTPMGMFEGILGTTTSVAPPAKQELVSPSPEEVAETDPSTMQFQKLLKELQGLAQWGEGKGYRWAPGDLRVLDPILQAGKGPGDLTGPERSALNKLLGTNRAQKKLKALSMSPSFKVAMSLKLAATSVYWKQPANQWFNIGLEKFEDANGRAIGSRRCETAISQFRADLITPEQAWAKEQSQFAAVYGAYVWLKNNDPMNAGSIDFDDMLQKAVALLVRDPRVLATMQARFKYILVDEAQDLNRMQHLLFGLIAGTIDPAAVSGARDIPSVKAVSYKDGRMAAKTFVFIGDDKQAIYEFRGARPDEFIEKSDLVEGEFSTVLLATNFRSGEVIVDAANKLIAHNEKQIPMTCDSNPEKGKGSIYNVVVADHQAGAELTADEIQQATSGEGATAAYSDFGVAVRTNAEAYAFGVEMIRRGIPFRSKVNFFNDATTQAILYWLRLAGADPGDKNTINECVLNAHKAPNFGLDKVFESALQQRARGQNYLEFLRNGGWQGIYNQEWRNRKNVKEYTDTLEQVFDMAGSPEELLGQILDLKGTMFKGVRQTIVDAMVNKVKGSPDAMDMLFEEVGGKDDVSDEAIRNMALAPIQPLMSLISGYEDVGPALDYVGKLQRANEKQGKKDDPKAPDYNEPAVVIDTCHGWKGLEVPHLYVPMARGVFPHKRSEEEGAEAMASERRLAYVALTRGEQSVTVINPMITHTGQPGGVSPFVNEACIKPPGHEDPSTDAAPARTTPERTAFLLSYAKGDFDDEADDTLAAWEMDE